MCLPTSQIVSPETANQLFFQASMALYKNIREHKNINIPFSTGPLKPKLSNNDLTIINEKYLLDKSCYKRRLKCNVL